MDSHWLTERISEFDDKTALITGRGVFSYRDIFNLACAWDEKFDKAGIKTGSVAAICGDYSPDSIASLLALICRRAVIVPIVEMPEGEKEKRFKIAACDFSVTPEDKTISVLEKNEKSPFIKSVQESGEAGLVLFSSGTTGEPKGMARLLNPLLDVHKHKNPVNTSLILFLLFDHIGGLNTLFGALPRGNRIVIPPSRAPETIASMIQDHKVEALPTSPSFLALMLASGAFDRFDLSCLKVVTYGTEPMPRTLLEQLREKLTHVRFIQKFGTSETGIINTQSRSSDSLDIKLSDLDQEYKVVDGELWIKSRQAVMGYLNAPESDSFTEDGWFKTGDLVEEKEDGWLRVLGRKREVINVGGRKVLPAEVESFLIGLPEVADCVAYGVASPLTGQVVAVDVVPALENISSDELKRILRSACLRSLERFKAPSKFNFMKELPGKKRFKKRRPSL